MPAESVQYTIRGIPPDVDRALRRKARQKGISLNRFLVEELTAAGAGSQGRRYRSVASLGRRWKEDPEFERILAEQRTVDPELWT
jgi:hypothetical protein